MNKKLSLPFLFDNDHFSIEKILEAEVFRFKHEVAQELAEKITINRERNRDGSISLNAIFNIEYEHNCEDTPIFKTLRHENSYLSLMNGDLQMTLDSTKTEFKNYKKHSDYKIFSINFFTHFFYCSLITILLFLIL